MEEQIEFLTDSVSFTGITFGGYFNIPENHLIELWNHYKKTGENLLDDYCAVRDIVEKSHPKYCNPLKSSEANKELRRISKIRRLQLFKPSYIHQALYKVQELRKAYVAQRVSDVEKKRNKASSYISKPKVRDEIFDTYGEQCLKCGSEDDICIDHIEPVSRGGKNELDNLQPLCRSCNSTKGTKTIDYRYNE